MKKKVRLTDKTTGEVLTAETEVRNLLHFEVQKNTKASVFKDKKKYNRKVKHRVNLEEDQ